MSPAAGCAAESHETGMRHPRDLAVPPEVMEAFDHLSEHLSEHGQQRLIGELIQALATSAKLDSMQPVHEVLQSWYRTLLALSSSDFETAMQEEPLGPPEGMTIEDIRKALHV